MIIFDGKDDCVDLIIDEEVITIDFWIKLITVK